MLINATLILQAINFLFLYCVLRIFFFKPVVVIIKQEQAHREGLGSQLNEKRRMLVVLEQGRQEQWHLAQKEFYKHFPSLITAQFYRVTKPSLHVETAITSSESLQQIKDELVSEIIQRVERASH